MKEDITWSDCSESQFLSQDDIVPATGKLVTIESFEKREIEGRNGEPDKEKVCVKFEEFEKPLVVNKINGDSIKVFTESPTPEDSVGKQLEIYIDETVSFGGKIVGGIRLRPVADIPY